MQIYSDLFFRFLPSKVPHTVIKRFNLETKKKNEDLIYMPVMLLVQK